MMIAKNDSCEMEKTNKIGTFFRWDVVVFNKILQIMSVVSLKEEKSMFKLPINNRYVEKCSELILSYLSTNFERFNKKN